MSIGETSDGGKWLNTALLAVNAILLSVIAFFMSNTYGEIQSVRADVKVITDKQTEYIIKQLIMEKNEARVDARLSTNEADIKELVKRLGEIQRENPMK